MATAEEIFASIKKATDSIPKMPKPQMYFIRAKISDDVVFSSSWTGRVSLEESQLSHFEKHYNDAHIKFHEPQKVLDWMKAIEGQTHHNGLDFEVLMMDIPKYDFMRDFQIKL